MSDLFTSVIKDVEDKCYAVEASLDLDKVEPTTGGDTMGDLIDKLQAMSPSRPLVKEIKDISEENVLVKDRPRPSGYSATSRFHVGRMRVPVLHDSGATCNCITEEHMVIIINHASRMLEEGKM
eukprot:6609114-Karenia_brevis.AAC.1